MHPKDFAIIFQRETIFVAIKLPPCFQHVKPLNIGANLKGRGSKFFPLKVVPNEKGGKYFHVKVISESYPFPLSSN